MNGSSLGGNHSWKILKNEQKFTLIIYRRVNIVEFIEILLNFWEFCGFLNVKISQYSHNFTRFNNSGGQSPAHFLYGRYFVRIVCPAILCLTSLVRLATPSALPSSSTRFLRRGLDYWFHWETGLFSIDWVRIFSNIVAVDIMTGSRWKVCEIVWILWIFGIARAVTFHKKAQYILYHMKNRNSKFHFQIVS